MQYAINPHRHVKIWISNQKDEFLPIINQLRLVRMREMNKDDEISLFIDSRLLTRLAVSAASQFCLKHNIQLYDIAKITQFNTPLEMDLFKLYEQEIFSLKYGGNLGRASDYLRWISCIYQKGIYSDFDVDIDTRECPKMLFADKPVLFKIGSIKIDLGPLYQQLNALNIPFEKKDKPYHQIFLNNDCIAISNDKEALKFIQTIQVELVKAAFIVSHENNVYRYLVEQNRAELDEKMGPVLAGFIDEDLRPFYQKLTNILMPYRALYSLTHIEHIVNEYYARFSSQLDNDSEFCHEMAQDLQAQFKTELSALKAFPIQDEAILSRIDALDGLLSEQDELIFCKNYVKEMAHDLKLKLVTFSSGPILIQNVLFNGQNLFKEGTLVKILPFTFLGCGLDDYFFSANSIPYQAPARKIQQLNQCAIGERGDCSWTDLGKDVLGKKDKKIQDSALIIQRAVRHCFFKMRKPDSTPELQAEEKACAPSKG